MPNHRRVRFTGEFTAKAKSMYSPDGSPDGQPTYQQFCENVRLAAEMAFARDFERYDAGDGAGVFTTAETTFFRRPMAFYAELAGDGVVEVFDLEVDPDWIDWDLELEEDDR